MFLQTSREIKMPLIVSHERPRAFDIFAINSFHVETVVSLCNKKPDSYIDVTMEFGKGENQIPYDKIKEKPTKVTYKMIQEYIKGKYGFQVHTAYIAEIKRSLGFHMYDTPNAVEELKNPRSHPTPEKVESRSI